MQRANGMKASVTFDRFSREERAVERVLGPSELHGKNPDKYRLWTKTLAEWPPGVAPAFDAIGDELALLVGTADAAGVDGGRFLKLSIHSDTGSGTVEIPADTISLASAVGLDVVVSIWNDAPDEVEDERRSLVVSTGSGVIFKSDDVMADLPEDLFAGLSGTGDVVSIEIEHEAMHADVRLTAKILRDVGRAGASVAVHFRPFAQA